MKSDHKFVFEKEDVWQVKINGDYTVTANFCKNGNMKACDNQKLSGKW